MVITLAQLHTSMALLNRMAEVKPAPSAKVAYKLGRVIRSARDEAQTLADAQLTLLQEHGKSVNGIEGQWEIEGSKREEFGQAWNELLTTEVELWGRKFQVDELEPIFLLVEFSVDEISRLEWLVDLEDGAS